MLIAKYLVIPHFNTVFDALSNDFFSEVASCFNLGDIRFPCFFNALITLKAFRSLSIDTTVFLIIQSTRFQMRVS